MPPVTVTLIGTREQIHAQLRQLARTHVIGHAWPLRLQRRGLRRRYRTHIHTWTP